jgi:hypothetical protein
MLDTASDSSSELVAFSFDFLAVLGHEPNGPIKVSYPEVIIACLHGYVKIAMWIMAIPSRDLYNFYMQLDTTVHISACNNIIPRDIN